MDRTLDRFPNKNKTFEFRIQTRARSETNNYKSLWIALLIGFQIRIELLNLESKPERDLKQIIIKVFGSCPRSVSTIRIELLNLESKPERDLKQIIIKVFGSRSWSVSKIRIELLNLESKPERDLKQIIIKVFGSRSWSVSENKLMF